MRLFCTYISLSLFILLKLSGQGQTSYFPPLSGSNWDSISPQSLGWDMAELDTLHDFLEQSNTRAFIVLKDGRMVLEEYFNGHTQDSLWYWASAGKTLTAFITGIAQEEGYLSINDTSSEYLGTGWTACPPAKEGKITIRHQLTMSSGLDDGVQDNYCTLDTCLQYLSDAGTRWAYHNAPYTLLRDVLENATGQNINIYVADKLLQHSGMEGAFIPQGYNNLFVSKARSMARFGWLILNHGIWDGDTLLHDTAYQHQMITPSQALNLSYGYLWWLNGQANYMLPGLQFQFNGPLFPDAPADMYAALGKNSQIINIVPSENLILIRMGDSPGGLSQIGPIYNNQIWQHLNEVIGMAVGVDETKNVRANIYPNPFTDHITISIGDPDFKANKISLIDMTGRTVYQGVFRETLKIENVPRGIYLLNLSGSKRNISKLLLRK